MGKALAPQYTQEEIDHGLVALALNAGNARGAHRQLKEVIPNGRLPSARTLERWKNQHEERYVQIRERELEGIIERIAIAWEDAAQNGAELTERALAEAKRRLEEEPDSIKDIGAFAQRVATSAGIATDKVFPLRSRPALIVEKRENRSADEIVRKLKHIAPDLFIEDDEVADADVVETDDLPPAA